jgi:hypothetical protein
MADFERTTAVGVPADAALDFFADTANLPLYVTTMTLVETIAIDGDPDAEPEEGAPPPAREPAAAPRFLVDRREHRVEWGSGDAYSGSITVKPSTPSMSDVTIRLHTRDDADPDEVRKVIEQTVRNIQRRLSGR